MEQTHREAVEPKLGLWDAVSIIVGIIIGVGIFEIPGEIFAIVPGPWTALGIWALGGVLALIGALCFAELSSTYPRSGGEYVYLTRAYGPMIGFLFAWAQLAVIRPGSIGAMAYVVANYGAKIWNLGEGSTFLLAVLPVLLLTVINILGVTLGKNTQNLLTVIKVLGLGAIVVVGFGWGRPASTYSQSSTEFVGQDGWFATSMIFILWTYAGWNEAAYIVSEIKEGRRNIPLALILGTILVTLIYLIVNAAYLMALGFEGAKGMAVPARVLGLAWGSYAAQAISILIMISALGAINGMIFTTARIYTEFGADHRLFQPLSKWSKTWGTPVRALVTQAAITTALLGGVSAWISFDPTMQFKEGLDRMIEVTAAVFWLFFLLTGIAVFVLRSIDSQRTRPFRVPGYPVLPLIFCLWCGYMVYGAINYSRLASLIGLGILLVGVVLFYLPKKIKRRPYHLPMEQTPVNVR